MLMFLSLAGYHLHNTNNELKLKTSYNQPINIPQSY